MLINIQKVRTELKERNDKSAWDKGVTLYALELLDNIEDAVNYDGVELTLDNVQKYALNGADSWKQYSYGGCSLTSDYDIAERLCTPSEFIRKDGGRLQPRQGMLWLDLQGKALNQAYIRMKGVMRQLQVE